MKRLNVGLLVTFNEADVIAEMLDANAAFVDAIVALDGSTDDTTRVLRAHPKVALVLRDEDVTGGGPARDFHRQALLDAARERFGPGHWFTLLHADEFFHDDPREVIERAEREGASFVNWASMQFFLHETDASRDLSAVSSVRDRVRWYSPFWVEVRQFRDRAGAAYRAGEHGRVFPRGVGWRPFSRMPVLRHYPFRSVEQVLARRETAGFGASWLAGPVFRATAGPAYRTARRFSGSFEEFEVSRQGSLVTMLLRQRRLVRAVRR